MPRAVPRRVAAMALGCMDALPHAGAVITLLTLTGLNRTSLPHALELTLLKTAVVFAMIALYYAAGFV